MFLRIKAKVPWMAHKSLHCLISTIPTYLWDWICLFRSPTLVTPLLFLKHTRHTVTSRPLNLLFICVNALPQIATQLVYHLCPQLSPPSLPLHISLSCSVGLYCTTVTWQTVYFKNLFVYWLCIPPIWKQHKDIDFCLSTSVSLASRILPGSKSLLNEWVMH